MPIHRLRHILTNTLSLMLGLAIAATPVLAEPPPGKGNKGGGHGKKGQDSEEVTASITLTTAGISVSAARSIAIDSGYRQGSYKPLPPGIRKNLARGKPLPPGIAKKMAPPNMISQLPRHPGYEWQVCGTDLVLIAIGTAIVADVLSDVFN
ncbi:anti-virulence regulator CigR family protein [Niveibacterium sp. 24ML]|uniref:anti-virulence regulator CigR family protein n=1 Tax=Niveibacterium sp. 24ML TaxID=2985512 RepID=UPI00227068B1|nr:anti-virulence regulator CigR family protein [Niveibacterium sp. 24ML]MCX9156365.1 anti-virulence regulator CigR family protein [Niveibacterium sp. 24ML]